MDIYKLLLRYNRSLPFKRWIFNNIVRPMPLKTKHKSLFVLPFQESMDILIKKITSRVPLMVGRYGFTELRNICRITTQKKRERLFNELCINAGFFPQDISLLPRFIELYKKVEQNLDILLPWSYRNDVVHNERWRISGLENCEYLCDIGIVGGVLGYPQDSDKDNDMCYHNYTYFVRNSFLSHLQDRKVLVISPFKQTILSQYKKLVDCGALPSFASFNVLQAVQSIGNSVISTLGGGVYYMVRCLRGYGVSY